MKILNELQLAKELIKFPSITPVDAGVLKFLEKNLKKLGFKTKIIEFKEKGLPDINIGSGVNTGTCIVGNMGSEMRLDYSVIGDAVNLAARLEAQTRNYKDENGKVIEHDIEEV